MLRNDLSACVSTNTALITDADTNIGNTLDALYNAIGNGGDRDAFDASYYSTFLDA